MSAYRALITIGLAWALLVVVSPGAWAQAGQDSIATSAELRERAVKRQRQGAGLRMGSWQMMGMGAVSGASVSTLPAMEGYFQKGLDRHLALETSVGFFQRTQRTGTGGESMTGYVIPMMTALKLYPATGPEASFEPFVTGGFGFTLGVDNRTTTTSGGLFGGGSSGGMMMVPGVGVKLGGGVEYRLGRAFGFGAGTNYQYVHFFDRVANARVYKGVQLLGGVTYRFQF